MGVTGGEERRSRPGGPEEIWAILRATTEIQRELQRDRRRDARRLRELGRRQERTAALLQTLGERQAEFRKGDAEFRKRQAEFRRSQAEYWKRQEREDSKLRALRRNQDRTAEQLRKLERLFVGQWGKLMESLVEGDLVRLLQERGVDVTRVTQRLALRDDPRQREIDLLAWNGEEIVAVEVKTTMKVRHVRRFEALLEELHDLLPVYRGLRLYGAVAYLRAEEDSAVYAERRGLFVIRATGSSASITNAGGFRPRVFGVGLEGSFTPRETDLPS